MRTVPARVISDGRVTIPEDVREELGVSEGDYVFVDVRPFKGGTEGDEQS
jgi:AbrB family looped-hinge helix DNA binding protein